MTTAERLIDLVTWWGGLALAARVGAEPIAAWLLKKTEPPHLGGTRRLGANDHPATEDPAT